VCQNVISLPLAVGQANESDTWPQFKKPSDIKKIIKINNSKRSHKFSTKLRIAATLQKPSPLSVVVCNFSVFNLKTKPSSFYIEKL